jgi:hypothetical protein
MSIPANIAHCRCAGQPREVAAIAGHGLQTHAHEAVKSHLARSKTQVEHQAEGRMNQLSCFYITNLERGFPMLFAIETLDYR